MDNIKVVRIPAPPRPPLWRRFFLLELLRGMTVTLFEQFLNRYSREMQIILNQEDLRLIACFRKANIRRSQDLLRKGKYGWQPKVEKAYLSTFCRDWLEQKDDFAMWPEKGRIN